MQEDITFTFLIKSLEVMKKLLQYLMTANDMSTAKIGKVIEVSRKNSVFDKIEMIPGKKYYYYIYTLLRDTQDQLEGLKFDVEPTSRYKGMENTLFFPLKLKHTAT